MDIVVPTTYTSPDDATARSVNSSAADPPKSVEYTNDEPAESILVTNAFTDVTLVDSWPPSVIGNPKPAVRPVT